MFPTSPFKNDAVDPRPVKKLGQKKAARPAPDDANLGAHFPSSLSLREIIRM